MKKLLALLLLALLALASFVACTATDTHEHTYDSVWLYDDAQHWHAASCEHEDMEADRGDHVDSDGNDICDVCGYIADHTHTFEAQWTADENTHYYKATCGHNVKKEEAKHSDVNNDGTCDVCDYNGGHEHTYADVLTAADDAYHWYAPTCGHTVEGLSKAAHTDENNDGDCDVCGYNGGHEHTYADTWSTTSDEHWKDVTCGHSVPASDRGVHKDENQDTACDICGYIPEHFHTFEEGWTSDENGHWHKATCEHDTVKNGEAAHDGYESDGVCDTCGFMVFRMYTVTVDAPDYVKVMSPDGVSGHSFAVRENTEFTFTFILPESAELVELTGGELVGEPVQENRKLTYIVRVPALNGDKTLTVAAVNYSAVEVIVENGTVSLTVEEAFKYAFADVVFDAPEAGKYMIFSPSHSDVPFGIGEMGEDGYPIYDQVYVLDVAAPGTVTVQARYFPWAVPDGGKLEVTYVVARIDGSLTLTDLVSEGYTLPTNVDTTIYFTAPSAGRYQISSSLLGLAWNDYICNSIILEATEAGQLMSFTVRYENTSAATFAFDCAVELMEAETVTEGENRVTAPYGSYHALTFTAEQDGAYKLEAVNPHFRFYLWNDESQSMVVQGASCIFEGLTAGDHATVYLSLDTFDYEGTEDITDVITVTYIGHIPTWEEGGYAAVVGMPNTFVNESDASEFQISAESGALVSLDGITWVESITAYCDLFDTLTYWVKTAEGSDASSVAVSVEAVTYEFTLSVGTQSVLMVPDKEYSVYLTASEDPAYYVDYILSWSDPNVTVVYNAAPVVSGEVIQSYSEYYAVTITYTGSEAAEVPFTLVSPYEA